MTDIATSRAVMHSIIQRIATGPELSKDISQEEARLGMQAILKGHVDDVQAAIFLIALRMKRETNEENLGILDAILQTSQSVTAEVDEVISIADPYDGFNRNLLVAPFLPMLLAECGLPAISHGLDKVGPKYGVTHRHVLQAAEMSVDLTVEQAAERLADPAVGWAYLDQSSFCPELHDLIPLRQRIIKRQVLTTVEVIAKPISGQKKTHLVTGYVHKPYPPKYATLARHAGFQGALLVRGTEGGVIPSLRQQGMVFRYDDFGEEVSQEINPRALGIHQEVRAVPLPENLPKQPRRGDEVAIMVDVEATAAAAAKAGIAALKGEPGPTYDSLLYAGSLILWHTGRETSLEAAANRLRTVLDSGNTLNRLR
ncbi:anthranilate phosphoribosyltransferase [endosymbiont of Ridgeia piscesae]|jgi:anthranilate phosphoribosyltransferase|uniref:Anthranilate phosphoribosyltransferase n=1 Tax=endosymbiont of Ridgeia piscesae TaxID=54398 RepID=A0A0T5Z265_9GAMM|nr:anthranilate phosphoribosyltransferase [endosymbiont of Ridgeia piscesae]KRT55940.1 Anthranilate phosphoribosyltransferase [endosymbiont of Ridgeia piscesae]KRT57012.1 Anthranilate phosphoribosyltransferase [endosymbiont of Ridgeia piscesae]